MPKKNHGFSKRLISGLMALCIFISNLIITYSNEDNGKGDIFARVLDSNKNPYPNISVMLYGRGESRDQLISTSSSDNYGNVLFDADELDRAGEFTEYYLIINQNSLKEQPYTIQEGALMPWEDYLFTGETRTDNMNNQQFYVTPEAPAEGGETEAPAEGRETEAPAEGGETETPTEGGETETPAEGEDTEEAEQEGEVSEENIDAEENQEENQQEELPSEEKTEENSPGEDSQGEVQAKGFINHVYETFIGTVFGLKTVYGEELSEESPEDENIPVEPETPGEPEEETGQSAPTENPEEENSPAETPEHREEGTAADTIDPKPEEPSTTNENALCWKLEVERLPWEAIEAISIPYDKSSFFTTDISYKYGGEDAPFFPDGDEEFEIPSGAIVNVRLEVVPALRAAIKNIGYTEIVYEFNIPTEYRNYIKSIKADEVAGLAGEISVSVEERLDEGIVSVKLTADRTNSIRGQAVIPLSLEFAKGEIPNDADFTVEGKFISAKAVNSNGEYRNIVYDIVPETEEEAALLPIKGKVKAYEEWKIENSVILAPIEKEKPIKAAFNLKTSIDNILRDNNLTITKNQVGRLYFEGFESNDSQSAYAVKGSFTGLKDGTKIKITSVKIKGTEEELIGTEYLSFNNALVSGAFELSNGEEFIISKFDTETVDGKEAPYATEYIIETELQFSDYLELDHTKPEPDKATIKLDSILDYTLIGEESAKKEDASEFIVGGYFGSLVTGSITVEKKITGAGGLSNSPYSSHIIQSFGFKPGVFKFYLLNKMPDNNMAGAELQGFLDNEENYAKRQKEDGSGFEPVAPSNNLNAEGKLVFTNIVEGTYYLYEAITDEEYSDYIWAGNGEAVSVGPNNRERQITVHNISQERIGLNFTKKVYDEKLNDVTSDYYNDIEFTLTGRGGTKTFIPNQYSGLIEMRNLPIGTYTLKESKTPDGFVGMGEITFTITSQASANSIYNLFTATGVTVTIPPGSETLYDKNSSILYNFKDTGILKIVKSYAPISGYTPELGAEFLIKPSAGETRTVNMKDGKREGDTQVLYVSLPAGTYTVTETNDTANNKRYYNVNNKESTSYTVKPLAVSGMNNIVTHTEENGTELQKITLKIGKYGISGSFRGTLKVNGIGGSVNNEIFDAQGKKINNTVITVSDKGIELYLPKGSYQVESVTITGDSTYYALPSQRFNVEEDGEYQFDLPKLGAVEVKSYKSDTNGSFSTAKYTIYKNGTKNTDMTLSGTVSKTTGAIVVPGADYRVKENSIDKGYNPNTDFTADTENTVNTKTGEAYATTNKYGYPDAVNSNIPNLIFDIAHSKQPVLTVKVTDVYVSSIARAGEIEIKDADGNIIKNASGADRHKITNKDTQIYLEKPGTYTITFFHTSESGLSPEQIDNRGNVDHKDKLSEEKRTATITVTEDGPNKAEFYVVGAGNINFQKVLKDLYAQRSHDEIINFTMYKEDKDGNRIGEGVKISTDANGFVKAQNLDPRYSYVFVEEESNQYEPLTLEGKFNIKKAADYALTIGPAVNETLYRQIEITKGGYKTMKVSDAYYPQKGENPIYDPKAERPDIVTTDRMAYNGLFRIYRLTDELKIKAENGTITSSDMAGAVLVDRVYTGTTQEENNKGLSRLLPYGDYLIVEEGPVNTGALYPYFDPTDKIPAYGEDTVYNYYKDGSKHYFYTTVSISKAIDKNDYAKRTFYNPFNDEYGGGGNKLVFAQVKIKKYDLKSSNLINNAVFDLYRAEADENGKILEFNEGLEKIQEGLTSGTAGNGMGISIVDLVVTVDKDGKVSPYQNLTNVIQRGDQYFACYYLVEISAPNGYSLWTTPILVEVPLDTKSAGPMINSSKEVSISNSMEEFTLTIEKYGYTDISLRNYVAMKDVEIVVTGSNGDQYTYKTGYRYKDGKEAGPSGSDAALIVEGFRKLSPSYTVKEKSLPSKYENDYTLRGDEIEVIFNDTARTAKAQIFNFPKVAFKAVKTDINGNAIQENLTASFDVYKNEGTSAIPSWVKIGNINANLKNGNDYYMVLGQKLGFGEYKFTELAAPSGYLPTADGKPAEIYFLYERNGNSVSVKYKLSQEEGYQAYSENLASLPKFKNDRKNQIEFYKKYVGPDGAELTGNSLINALNETRFALYQSQADAQAEENPIAIAEYHKGIDATGKVTFTGLEKNTPYYVKEIKGAEGYTLDERIIAVPAPDEANQIIKLEDFINPSKKGSLIVNKKDMNSSFIMEEVLFTIIPAERNDDGSFVLNEVDSSALKLTTGKGSRELDPGWYRIFEAKAPAGYDISAKISPDNNNNIVIEDEGAYVYIEPSKSIEITFQNGLLGSAEIFKYTALNNTEWGLNGVKLALIKIEKDRNGNWQVAENADAHEAVTSAKNGQAGYASFTGLKHGSYWIIEKESISGYKIPAYLSEEGFKDYLNNEDYETNIITVSDINPSAPLVKLKNDPSGGHLIINKYDISQKGEDGKPLADAELLRKEGTKFSIYKDVNGTVDRNNPLIVLDLKYGTMNTVLEEGDYLIAETSFPAGYPSADHESALESQREGAEGKKITVKAGETQVLDFFNEKLRVPDGTISKTIVSVDGEAVNAMNASAKSLLKNEVNAVFRLSGLFKTDSNGNEVKNNTPIRDVYVTDENIKYLSIANGDTSIINITGNAYHQAYRIKSVNIGAASDIDGPVYGRLYVKSFGSEQWVLYGSPVFLDDSKEINIDGETVKSIKVEYIKYNGDNAVTALNKGFTAGDIDISVVFPKWKTGESLPEVKQIINSASVHFAYVNEGNTPSEISKNSNVIRINPEVQRIEKAKFSLDKYTADGRNSYKAGEDVKFIIRAKNISQNIWRSPIIADQVPASLYTPDSSGYYAVRYNGAAYTGKIEFGKGETTDHKELLLWYMPELEMKPNDELIVELTLKSREYIYVSESNTAFASSGFFYAPTAENAKGFSIDIAQNMGNPNITNSIDKLLENIGAKPTGDIKEDFSNNTYAASTLQYTVSFAEGTVGYKLVKGDMDREYTNKVGSSTFGGTVSYKIGVANTTEKTVKATRLFDLLPKYNEDTSYKGEVNLSKIIIDSVFDNNKIKVYGSKTAEDLSALEMFFANKNGTFTNPLAGPELQQINPADFTNETVLSNYRAIVFEYTGEIQKGRAFYAELEFDLPKPVFTGTEAEQAAQYQSAITSKIQNTAQSVFISGNEGTRGNQVSADSRVIGMNAAISGYVWHDKDGDGLFNYQGNDIRPTGSDEKPLKDVKVSLTQYVNGNKTTFYQEATTDENGYFLFEDLPATVLINNAPQGSRYEYQIEVDPLTGEAAEYNSFTIKGEDNTISNNSKVTNEGISDIVELGVQGREFLNAGLLNKYKITIEKEFLAGEMLIEREGSIILNLVNADTKKIVSSFSVNSQSSRLSATVSDIPSGRYYIEETFENSPEVFAGIKVTVDGTEIGNTNGNIYRTEDFDISSKDAQIYIKVKNERAKDGELVLIKQVDHLVSQNDKFSFRVEGPGEFAQGKVYELSGSNGFRQTLQNIPRGLYTVTEILSDASDYLLNEISVEGTSSVSQDISKKQVQVYINGGGSSPVELTFSNISKTRTVIFEKELKDSFDIPEASEKIFVFNLYKYNSGTKAYDLFEEGFTVSNQRPSAPMEIPFGDYLIAEVSENNQSYDISKKYDVSFYQGGRKLDEMNYEGYSGAAFSINAQTDQEGITIKTLNKEKNNGSLIITKNLTVPNLENPGSHKGTVYEIKIVRESDNENTAYSATKYIQIKDSLAESVTFTDLPAGAYRVMELAYYYGEHLSWVDENNEPLGGTRVEFMDNFSLHYISQGSSENIVIVNEAEREEPQAFTITNIAKNYDVEIIKKLKGYENLDNKFSGTEFMLFNTETNDFYEAKVSSGKALFTNVPEGKYELREYVSDSNKGYEPEGNWTLRHETEGDRYYYLFNDEIILNRDTILEENGESRLLYRKEVVNKDLAASLVVEKDFDTSTPSEILKAMIENKDIEFYLLPGKDNTDIKAADALPLIYDSTLEGYVFKLENIDISAVKDYTLVEISPAGFTAKDWTSAEVFEKDGRIFNKLYTTVTFHNGDDALLSSGEAGTSHLIIKNVSVENIEEKGIVAVLKTFDENSVSQDKLSEMAKNISFALVSEEGTMISGFKELKPVNMDQLINSMENEAFKAEYKEDGLLKALFEKFNGNAKEALGFEVSGLAHGSYRLYEFTTDYFAPKGWTLEDNDSLIASAGLAPESYNAYYKTVDIGVNGDSYEPNQTGSALIHVIDLDNQIEKMDLEVIKRGTDGFWDTMKQLIGAEEKITMRFALERYAENGELTGINIVYKENSVNFGNLIDNDITVAFKGLEPGRYRLTEFSSKAYGPEEYNQEQWSFDRIDEYDGDGAEYYLYSRDIEIAPQSENVLAPQSIRVTNGMQTASIIIEKTMFNYDEGAQEGYAQITDMTDRITFALYKFEEGKDYSELEKLEGVSDVKTGKDGKAIFADIPHGRYVIKEVNRPAGYKTQWANDYSKVISIPEDTEVREKENQAGEAYVSVEYSENLENKIGFGRIEIEKILNLMPDIADSERPANANDNITFKLTGPYHKETGAELEGYGERTAETVNGKFVFENLPYGRYTLEELWPDNPPENYLTIWSAKDASGNEIIIEANSRRRTVDIEEIKSADGAMEGLTEISYKVENRVNLGTIEVTKTIASNSTDFYRNETFEIILYKVEGEREIFVERVYLRGDESHIFTNLKPGTYKVIEENNSLSWRRIFGDNDTLYTLGGSSSYNRKVVITNEYRYDPYIPPVGPVIPTRPVTPTTPTTPGTVTPPPGFVEIPAPEVPLGPADIIVPPVTEEDPLIEIIEEEVPLGSKLFKNNPKTGVYIDSAGSSMMLLIAGSLGLFLGIRKKK